jgi:predicted ArsR family transcriptional regulator
MAVLAEHGYEPARHGGAVRLRNCPFHQLVAEDRETVCHMSLALIEGLAAGLGAGTVRPVLDPQPGYCCVAVDADLP